MARICAGEPQKTNLIGRALGCRRAAGARLLPFHSDFLQAFEHTKVH